MEEQERKKLFEENANEKRELKMGVKRSYEPHVNNSHLHTCISY